MMRCPPLYERNLAVKKNIEWRKKIKKRIRNVERRPIEMNWNGQ